MKLGDFCFITNVNTQKNQGDDSDMLKGCKKKKKQSTLSFFLVKNNRPYRK